MTRRRLCTAVALVAALLARSSADADELSGADKLRVLYSPQLTLTREGLPLATVRLVEGLAEVRLHGSMRVLPDGEMGAELSAGQDWKVRLAQPGKASKERYPVVVGRAPASESERLQEEGRQWRERGYAPRTFELGSIFGIRGEVIDARQLQLTVAPHDELGAAQKEARALGERYHVDTGVYTELVTRPQGMVEAKDEHGTVLRNDGVLWFAPSKTDGTLRVDPPGKSYFGQIYITLDKNGTLAVVNAVSEDRLLFGLVPAEMLPSAPLEALKAQAVAARNQLLAKLGARHLGDPYRLCASTHCQVYAGAGQESPRATQAVLATRGELLVTGSPAAETLVDTVYSSSCGGHTEDNDQAWGTRPDPVLRGRLDLGEVGQLPRFAGRIGEADLLAFLARGPGEEPRPYCARPKGAQSAYRWNVRVSAETILGKTGPLGTLRDVEVLKRGASGRVVGLRIVGSTGSRDIHTELEVRRVLGGLKSSLISILPIKDARGDALLALEITGAGHGHGVGLCQYGAMGMGESGATYRQILDHYYPGARLRRFY